MMTSSAAHPTLLGVDVVLVGSILAGVGGMIWMGIGALIMAKMVNFEI